MKLTLNNITRILLWLIIGGAIMVWVAYAIDSQMDGWVSTVAVKNITIHDGSCRQLSGAAGYFVPTRTDTEWNAFNAVAASKGLTVAACGAGYTYIGQSAWQWPCYFPGSSAPWSMMWRQVYFQCARMTNGVLDGTYDVAWWPNCSGLWEREGHCFKRCDTGFDGQWISNDGLSCQ